MAPITLIIGPQKPVFCSENLPGLPGSRDDADELVDGPDRLLGASALGGRPPFFRGGNNGKQRPSTICCSVRPLPIGWSHPGSTVRHAATNTPAIMLPPGSRLAIKRRQHRVVGDAPGRTINSPALVLGTSTRAGSAGGTQGDHCVLRTADESRDRDTARRHGVSGCAEAVGAIPSQCEPQDQRQQDPGPPSERRTGAQQIEPPNGRAETDAERGRETAPIRATALSESRSFQSLVAGSTNSRAICSRLATISRSVLGLPDNRATSSTPASR